MQIHASHIAFALQEPLLKFMSVERRQQPGVVYMLSKPTIRARPGSNIVRRFVLETLYTTLVKNSQPPTAKWETPTDDVIEIDVVHHA